MPDLRPKRGSDVFQIRMPDGMRDIVKEAASRNGRSMNAEILSCLAMQYGYGGGSGDGAGSGDGTGFGQGSGDGAGAGDGSGCDNISHQRLPVPPSLVAEIVSEVIELLDKKYRNG